MDVSQLLILLGSVLAFLTLLLFDKELALVAAALLITGMAVVAVIIISFSLPYLPIIIILLGALVFNGGLRPRNMKKFWAIVTSHGSPKMKS